VIFENWCCKLSLWHVFAKFKMLNTMANTYTQCYFHLVFAVKNRDALIKKEWKDELEMYITGIVQNHSHKMLAIASMSDHMHILIGYNVNQLIPDMVEEIKTSTNAWIKEKRLSRFKFEWSRLRREIRCFYPFPLTN
jgi:REP element-mobilizing transposase RayT